MTREPLPPEIDEAAAPPPPTLPPAVAKADDLDAIRKSVEDAATVSSGLWISYLFVVIYLAIAAGAVTHVDLFLENPVKLPFLSGVELPITSFFLLAPLIFCVFHVYTLTYFVMLADKAKYYHDELHRQITGDQDETSAASSQAKEFRNRLRRLLPSNIFVQFLAGPDEIRSSAVGVLLQIVALTTLVIAPVLLLLLIQMQFLPYHSSEVTWTARLALLFDIVVVWRFWNAILSGRGESKLQQRAATSALTITGGALSLLALLFSWFVATFPGEAHDNRIPLVSSLHDGLFNGPVDKTTRHRSLFVSSTLVLPTFSIFEQLKVDEQKTLQPYKYLFRARGRDLRVRYSIFPTCLTSISKARACRTHLSTVPGSATHRCFVQSCKALCWIALMCRARGSMAPACKAHS